MDCKFNLYSIQLVATASTVFQFWPLRRNAATAPPTLSAEGAFRQFRRNEPRPKFLIFPQIFAESDRHIAYTGAYRVPRLLTH